MTKIWQVKRISLSADAIQFGENNVQYPYHVQGLNHAGGEGDHAYPFSWGLPRKFWENDQYDMSAVEHDERRA